MTVTSTLDGLRPSGRTGAAATLGLGRIVATLKCMRIAHPLRTRFANLFGASVSKATMRPTPRLRHRGRALVAQRPLGRAAGKTDAKSAQKLSHLQPYSCVPTGMKQLSIQSAGRLILGQPNAFRAASPTAITSLPPAQRFRPPRARSADRRRGSHARSSCHACASHRPVILCISTNAV
jgi:hypothetical protein